MERKAKVFMKWLDRYKCDIKEPQSIMYADVQNITVCIHVINGLGNGLYLNCTELNIRDVNLHSSDFTEAVVKAKNIIWKEFVKLQKGVYEFCNN